MKSINQKDMLDNLTQNLKKNQKYIFVLMVLIIIGIAYLSLYKRRNISDHRNYQSDTEVADVDIIEIIQPGATVDTLQIPNSIKISPKFNVNDEITEVTIYSYTPTKITDDYITQLYTKFNCNKRKILEDTLTNSKFIIISNDKNESIQFDLGLNQIKYEITLETDDTVFTEPINLSNFDNIARNFSKDFINDINNWKFVEYGYLLNDPSQYEYVSDYSNATSVKLIYNRYLDGIPIIDTVGDLTPNATEVIMTPTQNVKSALFQPVGEIGSKLGKEKVKTKDEIIQDIRNGKAKLISGDFLAGDTIKSITAEKAILSYYNIGNRLVPVYVIVSDTVNEQNETNTGYLIVDATKNDKSK